MLVQKQQMGLAEGGHQEGQSLALAAGKQPDLLIQPILQPHAQHAEPLPEVPPVLPGHGAEPSAPPGGERQVFRDGHAGRAALHGILKQLADHPAPVMGGRPGDVFPVQQNGSPVDQKAAADGVEEGGFSGPVGADNGDKLPGFRLQAHVLQCRPLIRGAGMEGFGYMAHLQHFFTPPPGCFSISAFFPRPVFSDKGRPGR